MVTVRRKILGHGHTDKRVTGDQTEDTGKVTSTSALTYRNNGGVSGIRAERKQVSPLTENRSRSH